MIYHYLLLFGLIQLKEYRFDRLLDFFRSAKGKEWLISYHAGTRIVVGLLMFVVSSIFGHVMYYVAAFAILDIALAMKRINSQGLERAILTKKILITLMGIFVVEMLLFSFALAHTAALVLVIARLPLALVVMAIIQCPTVAIKGLYIFAATKKLRRYTNVKRIGITGSYGKSSVKSLTQQLLQTSYKVAATPKNVNTEIGIARFILRTNFKNIDYFVVEMGAYRIGEIATICNMVCPTIGVLTAINDQHLSLFGSIESTTQAKYELLRAIPRDGYIVTNADNKYTTKYLDEVVCQNIQTVAVADESNASACITDIQVRLDGMNFSVSIPAGTTETFQTPLLGSHQATNATMALLVALHEGVDIQSIHLALTNIDTHTRGQLRIFSYGKTTVIADDSNANPAGAIVALELLSLFPSEKKRIVITRGMIELGEKHQVMHEKLGEEIAFVADELMIISQDALKPLRRGVGEKYHTKVLSIFDSTELLDYVKNLKQTESVILLLNRLPELVRREIKSEIGI